MISSVTDTITAYFDKVDLGTLKVVVQSSLDSIVNKVKSALEETATDFLDDIQKKIEDKMTSITADGTTTINDATTAMATFLIEQIDTSLSGVTQASEFIIDQVDSIAEKITGFTQKIMEYIFSGSDYIKSVLGGI